jgi:hypothetical protein
VRYVDLGVAELEEVAKIISEDLVLDQHVRDVAVEHDLERRLSARLLHKNAA